MHHFSDEQLRTMHHLIRACGQNAQRMATQQFQVYEKGHQDYVTDVDRTLDRQLTAGVAALFPTDLIISEENPDSWSAFSTNQEQLWLIDPLDGTDDFIQGRKHYAVMVGLLRTYQPVVGWVYAPEFDQLYYGGPNLGLFQLHGPSEPVVVQPVEPAPPSSDFCPILLGYKDQRRFGSTISRFIPAAQFSCVGSFGLKVLQVINGQAGLYIYLNQRVKLWDTTGPLAMAKTAGLICCDLNGEPLRFTPDVIDPITLAHQQSIIIGWPSYVETLLPRVRQAVMECQAA